MATMVQSSRHVMLAGAPVEECARRAQVVIVDGGRWHVIAPMPYRMHADVSFAPVPAVTCPVWDVSGVKDFERMRAVMDACVSPTLGVFNLAGLVTGLEALGGRRLVVGGGGLAVEKSTRVSGSRCQVSGSRCQVSGKARRVRAKARVQ